MGFRSSSLGFSGTPHPAIVTIRDNKDCFYSCSTTAILAKVCIVGNQHRNQSSVWTFSRFQAVQPAEKSQIMSVSRARFCPQGKTDSDRHWCAATALAVFEASDCFNEHTLDFRGSP